MSEFSARIDNRLTEIHKRRADLVRTCEVPESSVRRWVSGSMPAVDTAVKVAKFLGVSVEYLVTGEDSASGPKLAADEFNLIAGYRVLDERDRKTVLLFLEGLVGQYGDIRGVDTIVG